jgi:hypothetical protein
MANPPAIRQAVVYFGPPTAPGEASRSEGAGGKPLGDPSRSPDSRLRHLAAALLLRPRQCRGLSPRPGSPQDNPQKKVVFLSRSPARPYGEVKGEVKGAAKGCPKDSANEKAPFRIPADAAGLLPRPAAFPAEEVCPGLLSAEGSSRGCDQDATDKRPGQTGVVRGQPAAALRPAPGVWAGVVRSARPGGRDRVRCDDVRPPPVRLLHQPLGGNRSSKPDEKTGDSCHVCGPGRMGRCRGQKRRPDPGRNKRPEALGHLPAGAALAKLGWTSGRAAVFEGRGLDGSESLQAPVFGASSGRSQPPTRRFSMDLLIAVTSEELGDVSGGFLTPVPLPPVVLPPGPPCCCWGWGFPPLSSISA